MSKQLSCCDKILGRRLSGQMLRDHVSRKILGRISKTLWSLETYKYIDSNTKSYEIQKKFLLLFIFLSSRSWLSGSMPSDPIFLVICLQNFRILGRTHLVIQAFSDPRSVLQSEPPFAEFLADPQKANFSYNKWVDQTLGSRIFFHPHDGSKGLKFYVDQKRFLAITQATDQGWDWL